MVATVFGRWNTVEILTDAYRYRLQELATGLRSLSPMRRGPARPIILPVHQRISFYREKGAFILLDTAGHKHVFEVLGMESLKAGNFTPEENTAAGHFAIGERSMTEKNYIDALIEYRWALELAPDDPIIEQRIQVAEAAVDAQERARQDQP